MGRRRWIVLAVVVALGALVVGRALVRPDPTPIEQAHALLADADRFDSGERAGRQLAKVAEALDAAVEQCGRGVRCSALSSATGYAQVLAARVLTCTAPGREEARRRMDQFVTAADEASDDLPEPPDLPEC